MAATVTTIVKPNVLAPKFKVAMYQVALDTSYPTGGEAIDLSADFTYIYGVIPCGNNATADNLFKFDGVLPAPTVAASGSNVLIQATWDPADAGTAEDFAEVTATTDLSTVGQLSIMVVGY